MKDDKKALYRSQRIYGIILRFYPESYRREFGREMELVFYESLKDAYSQNGTRGLINLWLRMVVDIGRSMIDQHLEVQKELFFMKTKNSGIIMQNKVFAWIAVGTLILLAVPFLLMTLKIPLLDPGSGYEVINWSLFDFVVMGILISGAASLFVLVARRVSRKYRLAIAVACILGFLWLWAELAVGIFTNWGS